VNSPDWGSLESIQKQAHEIAQTHGWWDTADDCNVPTKLALAAGELVGEALETFRANKMELYYQYKNPETGKLQRITPEIHAEMLRQEAALQEGQRQYKQGDFKPAGFGIELADAIIRIGDLAEWLDIDLQQMVHIKQNFNRTRPMRHGGKKV